jgi:hypothetical protein
MQQYVVMVWYCMTVNKNQFQQSAGCLTWDTLLSLVLPTLPCGHWQKHVCDVYKELLYVFVSKGVSPCAAE